MRRPAIQPDPHVPGLLGSLLRSAVAPIVALAGALLVHRFFHQAMGESAAFYAKVTLDIGIAVILAVSLNIVNGFTGQFSIGHAGFMLTGGYVASSVTYYGTALLYGDKQQHGGWLSVSDDVANYVGPLLTGGDGLFLGACVAGGLAAALAGYLVGLPSLRLRGDYLAIVTLGFGEIVRVLFQNSGEQVLRVRAIKEATWPQILGGLGGSLGMTGIPFYTSLFWVLALAAVTVLAAYRIKQSSYGRALLAIREDEIAAEAMGVPTTKLKVRAFVLAAFFAGIAGALYAHMLGSINAGELGFMKSFDVVIMVVLGGMGSISGSVLAAVILTVLPELLRTIAGPTVAGLSSVISMEPGTQDELKQLISNNFRIIIYALLLILMMLLRPQGLFGVHEIWDVGPFRKLRRRSRIRVGGSP